MPARESLGRSKRWVRTVRRRAFTSERPVSPSPLGVAVLVLGALGGGWWFGEDLGAGPLPGWPALAFACLTLALATALSRGAFYRLGLALVVALALGAGYLRGRDAARRAYNECVLRASSVQRTIEAMRVRDGELPSSLADLDSTDIPPCDRPLRGTLLRYRRTGPASYQLTFADWMTSWYGDEQGPIGPHK